MYNIDYCNCHKSLSNTTFHFVVFVGLQYFCSIKYELGASRHGRGILDFSFPGLLAVRKKMANTGGNNWRFHRITRPDPGHLQRTLVSDWGLEKIMNETIFTELPHISNSAAWDRQYKGTTSGLISIAVSSCQVHETNKVSHMKYYTPLHDVCCRLTVSFLPLDDAMLLERYLSLYPGLTGGNAFGAR